MVPSSKVHPTYDMLQSSSQMARVQDFLPTEECDWRFIRPRWHHFGGLWKAAVTYMKHHLRRTLGSHFHPRGTLHITCWDKAGRNSRPLCALSSGPLKPTYLYPGHFVIGEPLTQLSAADHTNVTCNRLSRWQTHINSSGNDGHPTIYDRVFSSFNTGRGHPLIYNQVILSCWGSTTRHHSIGLQLPSLISVYKQMASSVWLHLGTPSEFQRPTTNI
jgi:hypothetical protein